MTPKEHLSFLLSVLTYKKNINSTFHFKTGGLKSLLSSICNKDDTTYTTWILIESDLKNKLPYQLFMKDLSIAINKLNGMWAKVTMPSAGTEYL